MSLLSLYTYGEIQMGHHHGMLLFFSLAFVLQYNGIVLIGNSLQCVADPLTPELPKPLGP